MNKDLLFNKLNSSKKTILFFLFAMVMGFSTYAQNRQITGKVTSPDDGFGMPGVSVKIKGTTTGVVTDGQGIYKISVSDNAVLEFSFIGFLTQQITVGKASVYNVKLATDSKNLAEVNVVSIGYGTAKTKDLTGSISSISAAQIAAVPVTSLEQSLQGRAAGVQVTNNDASPGGNVTVLIRGTGSLASYGNGPLYVIDGYPVNTGGINNINPSDIASIDVLKDASATAIYGIRAANGVVIVTTKKGRKDGVQVSADAYNGFQAKPKEYQVLNAQQFATLANAQAANDPAKQFTTLANYANPSSLTNADWQNAIYRSGYTQNYSLAIRGGDEKVQSATSLGFYSQKGIVLGSYYKRATIGENLDYQPTKWLKSSSSLKYTYQDSNNPFGTGSLGVLAQLPPTLDGGSNVTSQISDGNGNYGFYNPIYTYSAKYTNPVYTINTNQYVNINQYFLGSQSLEASIFDGLKIKSSGNITITNGNGSYFQPEDDRLVNQYGAQAGATQNAQYSQNLNTSFDWLWENFVSYDKTFGKHSVNFIAGVSAQETTYNNISGSGVPPNAVIKDLSKVTTGTLSLNSSAQTQQTLASTFARLNYKFDDRYFVTGTIRRDGSSKFADGHQYGVFSAGALKWVAKQEAFLKNVDWLSNLSFRGSYGVTGNQASIGLYGFEALYSTGSAANTSGNLGYPFGKTGGSSGTSNYQSGIAATQPANPNLHWETDYQTDFGTDFSFLHGDLSFTIEYFKRDSQGFLLNIAVPIQTGFSSETQNVGTINNKGWEFAANYGHTTSGLHYGVGLTVSVLRNELTSLYKGTNFITNFGGLGLNGNGWSTFTETNVGQGIGEFYGYKSLGIFQSQAQINALNAKALAKSGGAVSVYQQTATGPGDRYYADLNGDGYVNAADQTSLGSPQPKFFGGLNLDGSYKNFDFNLYFYGVYGNKILNYEESNLETFQNRGFVGVENISQEYYANAWTPTNPSNTFARIYYNDNSIGNALPSDQWIQDGSYLKLKSATIGYTFPSLLSKKIALSKLRIYASSQNLFTITHYKGLDPEIGTQGGNATQNGVDNGTYPSSRFYTIGLNVTF